MKKIAIFSIVFLSLLGVISCDKEEIMTYSSTDNIYFSPAVDPYVNSNGALILADSTGFSFGFDAPSITKKIYRIPIRVQGDVIAADRTVKVSVDPTSTAKEGTHFTLPKNIVMRAGKQVDTIDVTVIRTPDMKNATFTMVLNLEENDQFTTKMKTMVVNTLTNKTMNFISFKLSFEDKLTTPIGWFVPKLGTFTSKKLFLMCEQMSLVPAMFNQNLGSPGLSLADVDYYNAFMKRYLADQAASGNIIYEEDGTKMVFP